MSKTKFTPGPWKKGKAFASVVAETNEGMNLPGSYYTDSYKAYGGYLVAESISGANMHLIAAAPEMYALLESISDQVHEKLALFEDMCAQQTDEVSVEDDVSWMVEKLDRIDAILRKARGEDA